MSGKMILQRNWKQAVVLGGAVTLGAGAVPLACSGTPSENAGGGPGSTSTTTPNPVEGAGTLGFALSLPGGVVISSVTYDLLTSSGTPVLLPGVPNPGSVNVGSSAAIGFQLGGVPSATGDSITLTAPITGGGASYS